MYMQDFVNICFSNNIKLKNIVEFKFLNIEK